MLQTIVIKNTADPVFKLVLILYVSAFPEEERWKLITWETNINSGKTILHVFYWNNEFVGFMSFWVFDTFLFGEYFAIVDKFRNNGIGSIAMKECLQNLKTRMIIEVEKPIDDLTKRRVHFYKSFGFHLSAEEYKLLPLSEYVSPISMLLMSFPDALSKEEFHQVQQTLKTAFFS